MRLSLMKNKFLIANYDKYIVRTPNIIFFLDKCRNNNININNLKKIDNERYSFISSSKNKKNLLKFNDIELVKTYGIINFIDKFFKRKTTFICLVFSLCLYAFLSNRIYNVEISGNQDNLIPLVKEELENYNVVKLKKKISNNFALKVEKEILKKMKDKIEWIEIRQVGVNVKVNFLKRRSAPIIPSFGTSLYAQKDGMIVRFDISSGVKMVKEYDYVKKGDLLVSDTLITSNNEEKYVGAYGSVYAYTWYLLESTYYLTSKDKKDELEIYSLLLESNRAKIDKELTGDDEFLIKENILFFNKSNNKYTLKIHYTLLEDITL